MTTRFAAISLALLTACGGNTPDGGTPVEPSFRGLVAKPSLVAFTCVTPGCDSTQAVKIESTVNRQIAIRRIRLSDEETTEYTIESSTNAFVLGAASNFRVDIRFAPTTAPRPEAVRLLIAYTDASTDENDSERIEPAELVVPLVKRLVGEGTLTANPGFINFGVVDAGSAKNVPLNVVNGGFGNIALELEPLDGGLRDLRVDVPPEHLMPGEDIPVNFRYQPSTERYMKTNVTIRSPTPGVEPLLVPVEGTSFSVPRVTLEPEEASIVVGDIPRGKSAQVVLKVANVGGRRLNISEVRATDAPDEIDNLGRVSATFNGGATGWELDPLERTDVIIDIDGGTEGYIDGHLIIESDDPERNPFMVAIRGTITLPQLATSAGDGGIDWGRVPKGWVVPQRLELINVGYGIVTVSDIAFAGGTHQLLSFSGLPALPLKLDRGERAEFDINLRAAVSWNMAFPNIIITVEEPTRHFINVGLKGSVGECGEPGICEISNGTPLCSPTVGCAIGSCNAGWYDNDNEPATGCECRELENTDTGGDDCSEGVDKGQLNENGSSATHSGILHATYPDGVRKDDVDFISFYAYDNTSFFSEDFDVRIDLTSADPGIFMCISRNPSASLLPLLQCSSASETCGLRSFRRDGSLGTDDSARFNIKVYRTPSSTPSCTQYTVLMRNG